VACRNAMLQMEGGKARVLTDWTLAWELLRKSVCVATHGSLIASITASYMGKPHRQFMALVRGLLGYYAPRSPVASAAAHRHIHSLAVLPVQDGQVRDCVERLVEAVRVYVRVYGSLPTATPMNVAAIFELFRSSGLGGTKSSPVLRALAVQNLSLRSKLTAESSVEDLAAVLEVLVEADTSVNPAGAETVLSAAGVPDVRTKPSCWACGTRGHGWTKCKDRAALERFHLKYADPEPHPEDTDDDKFRRERVHASRSKSEPTLKKEPHPKPWETVMKSGAALPANESAEDEPYRPWAKATKSAAALAKSNIFLPNAPLLEEDEYE